jgi:hypothetical protein
MLMHTLSFPSPLAVLLPVMLFGWQTAISADNGDLRTNDYLLSHASAEPFYTEQGL